MLLDFCFSVSGFESESWFFICTCDPHWGLGSLSSKSTEQGPPLTVWEALGLFCFERKINYSHDHLGTGAVSSNTWPVPFRSPLGTTAYSPAEGQVCDYSGLPAKDLDVYASGVRGSGTHTLALRLIGSGMSVFRFMHLTGWRVTPITYECAQHTVWHVTGPQENPSKADRKLASRTWALIDTFWPNFCFLRELYLGNEL